MRESALQMPHLTQTREKRRLASLSGKQQASNQANKGILQHRAAKEMMMRRW